MSNLSFVIEIQKDLIRIASFSLNKPSFPELSYFREYSLDKDDTSLSEKISELLEEAGARPYPVYLLMQASDFIVKNISLPFSSSSRIAQVLPMEMAVNLSLPLEDYEIEFIRILKKASSSDLLSFAVEKKEIDQLIDPLRDSGYLVESIAVSQISSAIALARLENCTGFWLFLDTRGVLVFMSSLKPFCLRFIPSYKRGEELFISSFMAVLKEVLSFRHPEISDLSLYIQGEGRDFLKESFKESPFFTLKDMDQESFKFLDPLSLSSKKESAFLLASLSSIRKENQPRFREKSWGVEYFWTKYAGKLLPSIVLALVLLLFFSLKTGREIYSIKKRDESLSSEILEVFKSTLPEVKRIVDPLHQMRVHLADLEQLTTFSDSFNQNRTVIDLFKALAESIPEGVNMQFTRLSINADQLSLSGETDNYNDVDVFKKRLSASGVFSAVNISQASTDQEDGRVRFSLRSDLL